MVNVLFEYPQLSFGGTEMVMYNLARFINKADFHVDVLVQKHGSNENQFKKIGCNIYVIPYETRKNYKKALVSFFLQNHFDIVHTHTHSQMSTVLACAKKVGIPVRVAHSHVARIDIPRVLWYFQIFRNWGLESSTTLFCSCSSIAAKWLFPRHASVCHLIYNAIDLDHFRFNENVRRDKRLELGALNTTKIIINVSRCAEGKNHHFILDRAKALASEDMLFVLVGDGPLYDDLRNRIKTEHLENVRMLGNRRDVSDWLCAADIFIFPSAYEGLGIVSIEAQATGLYVIAADSIPSEADMHLGLFESVSLENPIKWENCLKNFIAKTPIERLLLSERACSSRYNIRIETTKIEKLYNAQLKNKKC